MKFGQLLRMAAIPQWRLCYLNYELLKSLIDLIIKASQIKERRRVFLSASDLELINQIINYSNKYFFKLHREEIMLTFAFVQYKLIFLTERKDELQVFYTSVNIGNEVFLSSIESLYVEVHYLSDLVKINLEGERKILKKHKKTMKKLDMKYPQKQSQMIGRLKNKIDQLIEQSEEIYIGKSSLKSKQSRINIRELLLKETSSTLALFFFGTGIGMAVAMIGVIIGLLSYAQIAIDADPLFVRDFHVFRGNLLLIIYLWMFSLNVFTFEKFHINYKLIFNIGSKQTSSHMFSRNSIITAVFLILLLTWVIERVTVQNNVMVYLGGISWLMTCTYFFIPIPFTSWRGRFYMLKLIGKAIISPIFGVDFPIIWLTDQLVSLVTSFKDFAYTICYYTRLDLEQTPTSSTNQCSAGANISVVFLVGLITFLWRIMQCIRQGIANKAYFCTPFFLNSIKYTTSLITLTLSFVYSASNKDIFPLWCVFSAISTIYSYIWDLKMDWGFFEKGTKNKFLRDNLAYGSPIIYYTIIVLNFILRLSWILTLSPNIVSSFKVKPIVFTLITGTLEIIRRSIWNLLRIQKQHIGNCVSLQAIKYDQNMVKLQIPEDIESSTRIGLSSIDEKQVKLLRETKLKQSILNRIDRKKKKTEVLENFINQKTAELKIIENRSRN